VEEEHGTIVLYFTPVFVLFLFDDDDDDGADDDDDEIMIHST